MDLLRFIRNHLELLSHELAPVKLHALRVLQAVATDASGVSALSEGEASVPLVRIAKQQDRMADLEGQLTSVYYGHQSMKLSN